MLLLLGLPVAAQTPLVTYSDAFLQRFDRTAPKLDYTVTVRDDDRSAYYVAVRIANAPNPSRLVIPEWAPGAYRVMASARNIAGVTAESGDGDGRALPVTADSMNGWTVETRGARAIVVRYSTALRTPAEWARANNRFFLRATSGMIDGPRTYMYLDGFKLSPSHVTFRLPTGWRVATGLVPTTDSTVYWAPSYDVLIDSPVLVGEFALHHFLAGGVPHRAAVDLGGGTTPGYDAAAFTEMLRRICESAIAVFGSAPYKDYTFLYSGIGGGLEHLNSTTIGIDPARLARDPRYRSEVTAHEFFHTWNVKRIRPAELGPFDYTRPVRSLGLWLSEGVTDYYADLILVRAGLDSVPRFVDKLGDAIGRHRRNPARLFISPERSSWTTWDGPEVNGGRSISYYLQGQLLGLLLDLTIRDSTDNRKSLDDVMRYLFDHYAGARGFAGDDVLNAVLAETGLDLQVFWERYISGAAEVPWNDFLRAAGWRIDFTPTRVPDRQLAATNPTVQGGRPVAVVTAGTAAAKAGLRSGDVLTELNGRGLTTAGDVTAAMQELRVGDEVNVRATRQGQPVTARWRIGTISEAASRIVELAPAAITEKMRRIRAGLVTGSP